MQTFKADTAWKRFSCTFTPTEPGYFIYIYPMAVGMFYLDAVQLEEGTEATAYEPN